MTLAERWHQLRAYLHLTWETTKDWQERQQLADDIDFVEDATREMIEQDARGVRAVVWVCLFLVLSLLFWASMARIDEVAKGEGKVIPASQIQIIQSLDGGIVEELHIRVGDIVEKGQLLLKVDPTRFNSSLRESEVSVTALRMKALRLDAIAEEKPFEPPPELVARDPTLAAQERRLYEARLSELEANRQIANEQAAQREQELNEARSREIQASSGYQLAAKELSMTRPLVQSGAVSSVELLRLEREVGRLLGDRDAARTQIPRLTAALAEAARKKEAVELEFRNQVRSELADTNAKLKSLTESQVGLADRVKQSELRSPVRGTVKQLFINTVGGVVQPGKDIAEIVPLEGSLLLETRILPKDIAFIHPGQDAMVKFTAYDFSVYGGMEARVEQISADTVTDDKGNAFYVVRVRTQHTTLGAARLPIIPGMVAEVDVLTGKRTVLSYLLKPVLRAKASALRES